MLRRTPIFVAVEAQTVSSGLQPDRHSLHKTLWETAENVVFFGGKVRRRIPSGLLIDPGTALPIRGLSQQRDTDGVRWLWVAAGGDVYRWYAGSAELIIDDATWQEDTGLLYDPTFWDFTHYGDWTIINSGIGAAQIYKPDTVSPVLENYGDAPVDVTQFMKKLSYVLAIGYGERGTRVGWSDSADIEVYTASASNNAGALSIDDFDTRIKAAAPLGQSIALFGEDQMGMLNFINAPFYWGQKTVLDGIGAVSKKAVASDGKNVVGIGRRGIWWTDSNSFRYIDEASPEGRGMLHDYLQENVNWDEQGKCFALRNDHTGCYEFHFPVGESTVVNEGWAFDPRTTGWSKVPGVSLKDERRIFGYPLVGLDDGEVHLDNSSPTTAAALSLETRPLLMQVQTLEGYVDSHTSSRVDEVELLIKAASNVEFRVKSGQTLDEDFDLNATPWMEVDETTQTIQLPAMADGVYWKLEFRSTADNWDLDLQGFLLYGVVEGTKRANT